VTPGRILVVDDHPANLRLATEVLAGAGYDVLKAADAEEALAILEQTPIDLILMDISLPGMDGLELTRRLKADASTRQLCIVALTALAMRGDDQKALDAGCDGYITKPIDTRRLPSQVAEFLRRKAEGKAPPWVF
jgi:two-component system, cell cycle response regulator DivK